ncbi:MAG: DUF1579 domain-containing protein [Planctomycetota bacterium]
MPRPVTRLAAGSLLAFCSVALGQPPEMPGVAPEHALLQRFVGQWETAGECDGAAEKDGAEQEGAEEDGAMVNRGTITGRMLGERWVVCEYTMNAGGARIEATLTLGYDTRQQKYVGTWIDSMQNQLWVYEGDYDPETQTLTLDTEGPNLMGDGQMTPFRDAHQFVSDDEMVSRSSAVDETGAWVTFMESRATRVKP